MGYKQVTIRHLSEELDLDRSTICRALKGSPKVGKNTVEKVRQYAQLRGYNVNWRDKSDLGGDRAAKPKAVRVAKVTIYHIAKYMQISPATVSRALNNCSTTSKKTIAKVMQIADEMGYSPNLNAKRLRLKVLQGGAVEDGTHTTVYTMAKELHLSASTISRALLNNGHISEQTKSCVIDLANKIGYTPSKTARDLKAGNEM